MLQVKDAISVEKVISKEEQEQFKARIQIADDQKEYKHYVIVGFDEANELSTLEITASLSAAQMVLAALQLQTEALDRFERASFHERLEIISMIIQHGMDECRVFEHR